MNGITMHEEMLNFLRKEDGATSEALARQFLMLKNPDPALAHRLIEALLGKDRRCFFGEDKRWHARAVQNVPGAAQDLRTMPWCAVHVLCGPANGPRRVFHVSAWSLFPEPVLLFNEWLENPETLPVEEQATLVMTGDPPFAARSADDRLDSLALLLEERMPVFLSGAQAGALQQFARRRGAAVSDNVVLLNGLFRLAAAPLPRPFSLENCHRALFERDPAPSGARGLGEALARCAAELFERCIAAGRATTEDLDAAEGDMAAGFDFSSKAFSLGDLLALPQTPGVYAFLDSGGAYLYIGKSTNLRRRLLGYFRESEESPEKLERLRSGAHRFITYACGSELESLVYEYRLIRKHRPLLNRQTDIEERKGAFRPVDDCIVLLPHAENNKVMSFWFRRNQKILLKPLDLPFSPSKELIDELNIFFFSPKLAAQPTDFPEQEIAVRWLKTHEGACTVVPVGRMAGAGEIGAAIGGYIMEMGESGS
jgi:hypothetical protein